MKAAVLTVSDGVVAGTREDRSGDVLADLLAGDGYEVERRVVPDEAGEIAAAITELAAHGVPRVALWGRGVDTATYSPELRRSPQVAQLRSRLAPNGEVIVGYVGRLAPEKELHRLAEIADRWSDPSDRDTGLRPGRWDDPTTS